MVAGHSPTEGTYVHYPLPALLESWLGFFRQV